jgi:hypothetical protein
MTLIRVDWYKPSRKWYAGGTVDVGDVKLYDGINAMLNAISRNQKVLPGSGIEMHWTIVIDDLPENKERADYHEFFKAVLQVGQYERENT